MPARVANPDLALGYRSKRILVVGETAPDPVAGALSAAGYTVSEATSMPPALAALEHAQVALIVLDCPQVVANCQALRRVTSVPILALLPELTEAAVLDAFSAGADDCQAVSISPPEIVLRVRAILRRGKAQASAAGTVPGDSDPEMRRAA